MPKTETTEEMLQQIENLATVVAELAERLGAVENAWAQIVEQMDSHFAESARRDNEIVESFTQFQTALEPILDEFQKFYEGMQSRMERLEAGYAPPNTVGVETLGALQDRINERVESLRQLVLGHDVSGQLEVLEERVNAIENDIERLYKRLTAIELELQSH